MAHGEQDLTGWEGEVERARMRERDGLQTRGQTAGRSQSPTPKSCGRRWNRRYGISSRVRRAWSLGCAPRAGGRRGFGTCICVRGGVSSPEMRLNVGETAAVPLHSLLMREERVTKRENSVKLLTECISRTYKRTEVLGKLPFGDSPRLAPIWKLLPSTSHLWAKHGTCSLS